MNGKPVVIYRGSLRQAIGSAKEWDEVRQTLANYLETGYTITGIAKGKDGMGRTCVYAYLLHQGGE